MLCAGDRKFKKSLGRSFPSRNKKQKKQLSFLASMYVWKKPAHPLTITTAGAESRRTGVFQGEGEPDPAMRALDLRLKVSDFKHAVKATPERLRDPSDNVLARPNNIP